MNDYNLKLKEFEKLYNAVLSLDLENEYNRWYKKIIHLIVF